MTRSDHSEEDRTGQRGSKDERFNRLSFVDKGLASEDRRDL